MNKYIDADKLIAEIERRLKIVEPHKNTFESAAACRQELIWMKNFIDSLHQEQPEVDLEKEIIRYQREDMDRDTTVGDVARHFWNKGYNARKEE